jgi:hypothetical protein
MGYYVILSQYLPGRNNEHHEISQTQTEGVREQGAEENIWTKER